MSHRTQPRSKNKITPNAAPSSKRNTGRNKVGKTKGNKKDNIPAVCVHILYNFSPLRLDEQADTERPDSPEVVAPSDSSTIHKETAREVLDCVLITTRKSNNDTQTMNLSQAEARLKAAAAKATPNASNKNHLIERVDLLSTGDFTDDDVEAINFSLQGDQSYRFPYPEGGYRQYHGLPPVEGPHSPADEHTMMFDEDSSTWVPIPPDFTAPHLLQDYIEAVNDVRKVSRNCSAYVHPEAKRVFKELNDSRGLGDAELNLIQINGLSLEEERALEAGLNGEGAVYKFKKPWDEGYVHYHGRPPRLGQQNAADRLTEIWDEKRDKYVGIPDGCMAPHDPQDYADAVNWEVAQAETTRRAEVARAARHAGVNNKREVKDYKEWDVPDPMIESDLSGSDYEEARRELENKRAWQKSRGKPVSDTEEEDEEEDREMQCELQEEARSQVVHRVIKRSSSDEEMDLKGKPPTSSDAFWEALRASFTPSQKDAACILRSYGLTLKPDALLTDLEEVSSKKLSLLETAMYPMFGNIVWQLAGKIGNPYGRTAQFAMEKAGLVQKEKRAQNRYNIYKSFASQSKPEDGNCEGLLLWNKTNNEEYKKLMEGATTKEEKDECIKNAVKFLQDQVTNEGTNVRDASLCFTDHLKAITDLITNIKRRDRSFDFAGIMVYSGKNQTARNKSGFFMKWPISMLTDVFVSKVRVMHVDRKIKGQMMQQASSTTVPATAERLTASPSTAHPKVSIIAVAPEENVLPNVKDRQRQFSDLFLNLLNSHLPQKEQRKSVPWTTWPNIAYQFQLVITGWDSMMMDIGFCRSFVSTKIQNRQWMHFSTLIIKGLLEIKSWNANEKQIAETDARFGEIPVILNQQGLPMVFVKDSNKWVRDNCLISTAANKQQRNGMASSPLSVSSPPSVAPSKKHSRDDAMCLPDERQDAKSAREYRPIPKQKQTQEEPAAKRQQRVSFVGLPDNMFYKKRRQATQPISQSTQAGPSGSHNRAGPGKNSGGFIIN
ncbi:hypothetical protein K443DRAFT_131951 [Laccaria amethystina LaAM-08-1]|uniref:Uncharacterized protein n=1 Tax=Laccaria amethystina LaAM-08-1 TaxID=1095629 RepID=A0A0C9WTA5_9AGAR|nr:hypothetical protein K443DRAFT_131951 [Laccaria amethystina LaAM-08-1]